MDPKEFCGEQAAETDIRRHGRVIYPGTRTARVRYPDPYLDQSTSQ